MVSFIQHWIGDLWAIFAVLWFGTALISKRSVQRQTSGSRILQSGILLLGMWLIFNFGHVFTRGWLADVAVPDNAGWVLSGAALTIAGMLFAAWARTILGRNWSARVTIKQDHELIQRAPYSLVRHPIYTGLLFALLGTSFVIGFARCFVGLAICLFGLWLKTQTEEQFMIQQFGEQYAHYRRRVRALVPFVL